MKARSMGKLTRNSVITEGIEDSSAALMTRIMQLAEAGQLDDALSVASSANKVTEAMQNARGYA